MVIRFILVLFSINILVSSIPAQGVKKDADEQVKIILNALNYNKTLKQKIKKNCVIAVLYNPKSKISEEDKNNIVQALKNNKKIKVHGKKLKVIDMPMDPSVNLEKNIIIKKINTLWLTQDLKFYINSIRESAKYNQVTTISLDQNMVANSMVALGIQKTESGNKLMINMQEATNIKVDLNQNLLSEAIVIQ